MIVGLACPLMSRTQFLTAVGLTSAALGALAQSAPLAESPRSEIEYSSPGAALNALRADPGVIFERQNGWIVASDAAKRVVWSFAPKDDPAYPTVVKRVVVERDGRISMDMTVLCNASKSACDDLVRKFARLNGQVKQDLQSSSPEPSSASGR